MSNFNDTTPAPPTNSINVKWQYDASGNVSSYHLPATTTTAGLVKIGSGVQVAADGTINSNVQTARITSGAVTPALTDQLLFVTGSVTLPLSPVLGQVLTIYNYSGTAIVVSANTGQSIYAWSGTTTATLGSITVGGFSSVTLAASGATGWYITSNNGTASTQGYQAGIAPATSAIAGVVKQGPGTSIATDGTISGNVGNVVNSGGSYTMLNTDNYVWVAGGASVSVTLPPNPLTGQKVGIYNYSPVGSAATVTANTGQQIICWNGVGNSYAAATSLPLDGQSSIELIYTAASSRWNPYNSPLTVPGSTTYRGGLPPATSAMLGGVKQGSGVSIASDGTLSTNVAPGRIANSNLTANLTDTLIWVVNAGVTITLNASPVAGQMLTISSTATSNVATVNANTGQTISVWNGNNGLNTAATSLTLQGGASVTLLAYSSTVWEVVGSNGVGSTTLGNYIAGLSPATSTTAGVVKQGSGVSIAADGTLSVGAASSWQTWTPTVTPGGSMTFSPLTVVRSRYMQVGAIVHLDLQVNFTVGGTPTASFTVTLPVNPFTSYAVPLGFYNATTVTWNANIGAVTASGLTIYGGTASGNAFVNGSSYQMFGPYLYYSA